MAIGKSLIRKDKPRSTGLMFSVMHKLIPILIFLTSMFIATQKFARDIDYDENIIGKPFVVIKGEPVYPPHMIFVSFLVGMSKMDMKTSDIIYKDIKLTAYGVFIALVFYLILSYVRQAINNQDKDLLARAHWGDKKQFEMLGLDKDQGVVIGQRYDAVIDASTSSGSVKLDVLKTSKLVCYDSDVNGLLMAGTRLAKGVSTVVPTHLIYPNSIISVDPKSENYAITAGYRWQFSYIYKLEPQSKNTLRFNFLDEITEEHPFADASMIADILVAPTNPNANQDPHWTNLAKVLVTAAILHCKCSSYEDKSLPGVYKFLSQVNQGEGNGQVKILKQMIEATHCREDIHGSICSYAQQIMNAAEEERGSIFSSALECLSCFNNPNVAWISREGDFCLDDFKYCDAPISLYITFTVPELLDLKNLIRLYIEMICRKFSNEFTQYGKQVLKTRILFILDEFPLLGTVKTVELFAGILAGFGLNFLWICQSKSQIEQLYGQNAPLFEHSRFLWIFAINEHNSAEYFSQRIGDKGIIKQNTSSSGSRFDFGMNNVSVSNDISSTRLFTANEIENLPPDTVILMPQGGQAMLLKKVAYYSDPRFKDKANLPYPKTRKQLLKETEKSHVLRPGDPRWFDVEEDYSMTALADVDNSDIEASDITERMKAANPGESNSTLQGAIV